MVIMDMVIMGIATSDKIISNDDDDDEPIINIIQQENGIKKDTI